MAIVASSKEFAKNCQKKFSISKDDISNQNVGNNKYLYTDKKSKKHYRLYFHAYLLKNLSMTWIFEIGNEEGDDDQKENDSLAENIFGNGPVIFEMMKKICLEHSKFYNDDVVVNLNPKSSFFKQLSIDLIEEYNEELDIMTENLIPENLHNFLVKFFSERLSEDEWLIKIDDLICSNKNDKLMVTISRVIWCTLPQFIKAFFLGPFNPLLNITSIERPHLNSFVHICLESTLWNVACVSYEFSEIHFHSNLKCEYADEKLTKIKNQEFGMEGMRYESLSANAETTTTAIAHTLSPPRKKNVVTKFEALNSGSDLCSYEIPIFEFKSDLINLIQ
nr:11477_t:CDS:2 [Entrophospora candida]